MQVADLHRATFDRQVTINWDIIYPTLGSRFAKPELLANLAVAPLPGSRWVQDRRPGSSTYGQLVACDWELCRTSAVHDLLYLTPNASASSSSVAARAAALARQLPGQAPDEDILVNGAPPERCDPRATAGLEAAAVTRVLGDGALSQLAKERPVPINRAPYSALLGAYNRFGSGAGSESGRFASISAGR